jgi:glycosyltransferase involved in cell wall biosynthesis
MDDTRDRRGTSQRSDGKAPTGEISVLHVVDCLNVGGTERQLFELIRRADRVRFPPLVACFKPGGELQPQLAELGVPTMFFPLHGSLARANTAYQIGRMAWLCARHRVKIVHAHDFYSNLIGVAAARLAGVRCIASRRDLAHWLSPNQRRALRLACRAADLVVANAHAIAELGGAEGGASNRRAEVVPNGIDVAEFDRQARKPPAPPLPPVREGVPRIAMVGAMHIADKGHADLLTAAALLKERGVAAQWLLLSDGALRPELEARARLLGVAGEVHFLGRRADVASVLARVDLLAHPSWAEGFPNVVLEAMCASKPVVATRVGGVPEVLVDHETGVLVEPRQPAQLAAAITRVLGDPQAARVMGVRGRQRAQSVYSLERMCATFEDLYARLVERTPTGAAAMRARDVA